MIKALGYYEALKKERGLKAKKTPTDPTLVTQNSTTTQTTPHISINDTQNVSTLRGNNVTNGLGKSFTDMLLEIDQELMMFDSHKCNNHGVIAANTRATAVD